MNASTLGILSVMALATAFSAGCSAAETEEDVSRDEGAMSSYSAHRTPLDNGHYASNDGKTLVFLKTVDHEQHASVYANGVIVEASIDISILTGISVSYRDGILKCTDNLTYVNKRGIQVGGSCIDPTDLFADNDSLIGAKTSKADATKKLTVKKATATDLTLDLEGLAGVKATWTTAVEARGTAGTCGSIAVVFADAEHAAAYWVGAAPSDASCPSLPVYP